MAVPRWFITADKILISIHRTAKTIWVIKIIRTAGIIFTKRICLSHKILQRVGIITKRKKAVAMQRLFLVLITVHVAFIH